MDKSGPMTATIAVEDSKQINFPKILVGSNMCIISLERAFLRHISFTNCSHNYTAVNIFSDADGGNKLVYYVFRAVLSISVTREQISMTNLLKFHRKCEDSKSTKDDAPEEGVRGATKSILSGRDVQSPFQVALQSGLMYALCCGWCSKRSSDIGACEWCGCIDLGRSAM